MIRVFRHYVPLSLLFLGFGEILVLVISVFTGVQVYVILTNSDYANFSQFLSVKALLFTGVMFTSMVAMGLYWRHGQEGWLSRLFRITISMLLGMVILTFLFYFFPDFAFGRGVFSIMLVIGFIGVLSAHYLHYYFSDHDALKRPILVLGSGSKASQLEKLRKKSNWSGAKLIGYVPMPQQQIVVDERKLIVSTKTLYELAKTYKIDEIVVAIDERRIGFPADQLLECKMNGINIIDSQTFLERQMKKIYLEALNAGTLIYAEGFKKSLFGSYSKRLFDYCVSLFLLVLISPIILLAMVAIFIEARGRESIFYRQVRVGKNEVPFEILKFRTMCVDAEKEGKAIFAGKNDPRVTMIGRILRPSRVDELPQLINVLKGDMSFVGPRPERSEFVKEFAEKIPFYNLRHRVKPGITGWAQICYPYGSGEEDARKKLEYDLYYMKNYSLLLDFYIIVRTIDTVLWSRGGR